MDFHQETKVYRESSEPHPLHESERLTAAAIVLQSFIDYHSAKKLLADRGVNGSSSIAERVRRFRSRRSDEQVGTVLLGKTAWEWFINPPLKGCKDGWTLEKCCSVLHLDIDVIRKEFKKPSAFRLYRNWLNCTSHEKSGEKNGRAKLREEEVKQILAYRKDGLTQKNIADRYGVSQRLISDIVNGKRWKTLNA